jgi:hypothetical protein
VRLWHGTVDKNAWSIIAKDAFSPNCRLFQVDKEAIAAAQGASQQQQHRGVVRQPSFRGALGAAAAAADAAGVTRIPAGEVGAGLPMVVGGASEYSLVCDAARVRRSSSCPAFGTLLCCAAAVDVQESQIAICLLAALVAHVPLLYRLR